MYEFARTLISKECNACQAVAVQAFERNDIRQYDELVDEWWDPQGQFAMLHWIAEARASLIPQATGDATLVDFGCGGGLLAPHVARKGYRHIGVDLSKTALDVAHEYGVECIHSDVTSVPLPDAMADVVCLGEILEHVEDTDAAVAEACRVLKPGGTVVVDTIANTLIGKFLTVTIAERIPGGAPRGIHDPKLFVDRDGLVLSFATQGVDISSRGLRPSLRSLLAWKCKLRPAGKMVPTRSTAVLFQSWGTKRQ